MQLIYYCEKQGFVDTMQAYIVMSCASITVILMVCASSTVDAQSTDCPFCGDSVGTVLFTALGISFVAIALHGALRQPDDLFTDEPEVHLHPLAASCIRRHRQAVHGIDTLPYCTGQQCV